MRWEIGEPPPMVRLLVLVLYKDYHSTYTKHMIAHFDPDRNMWRWEAGAITGVVTHWTHLPQIPQ